MNLEELRKKTNELYRKIDQPIYRCVTDTYKHGWRDACIQVLMAIDLMQEEIDNKEERKK